MHMAALRHLADDVRERFARLRLRGGDDSADKSKQRRRDKVTTASAGNNNVASDRTATPDLIRPHVDSKSAGASLPPLPPPPCTALDRPPPRRRRRSSVYLCPSASAAVMGHIYEEIPPTPPPPLQQQQEHCSGSCVELQQLVGRVYYVSPLDGALCRIFPVDEERAVHGRQLACVHVRQLHSTTSDEDGRASPVDVSNITARGLSSVRGRELRLCTACYRHLRSGLSDETATASRRRNDGAPTVSSPSLSSLDYNSCDLSLLNVPPYSSEVGDVDHHDDDVGRTDARRSNSDADASALPTTQNVVISGGDVISDVTANGGTTPTTLRLGEAGSAFTKFDGGRRSRGPPTLKGYDGDNTCCDSRRRRAVTNSSFDERRRPLKNPDDAVLHFLDSFSAHRPDDHMDIRSHCRHDFMSYGLPVAVERRRGVSTSCADVRSARRRSLAALRRRSDDDDVRRGRLQRQPSGAGARRTSACCSAGSDSSIHHHARFAGVKSVYYNGLLASMIDLTAACDRRAADDDRLSCRATSGPRRSLRATSGQSPPVAVLSDDDRCRRADRRFTSSVHHSSGDLLLRSVQ